MDLHTVDEMCRNIQAMVFSKLGKAPDEINTFTAPETTRTVRDDGVVYVNDIKYSERYPNGFLDIWYADTTDTARPTIVYFHGGGFLFGDKVSGDPLAAEAGGSVGLMLRLLREGYNLVSVNYALAPEYRFPVQVRQGNEALLWLCAHAEELHLDMEQIVIMGSSAGANMTLLLGQVIANPQYALALKIEKTVNPGIVKALVVDESALSVGGMSQNLDTMCASWLGETDVVSGPKATLLAAQNHMGKSFFPVFINASNVEPIFLEEAKHTKAAMDQVGAPYKFFYRTQEEAGELPHGFIELFAVNPASKECLKQVLVFLKTYVN